MFAARTEPHAKVISAQKAARIRVVFISELRTDSGTEMRQAAATLVRSRGQANIDARRNTF
jgi:hypothetical protein